MSEFESQLDALEEALAMGHLRSATAIVKSLRRCLADDRERRIRELAREWVGRLTLPADDGGYIYTAGPKDVPGLMADAARLIDALDAAEVPKKGGE